MNALFLDNDRLMCGAKRNRLPLGATSGGGGYFASGVIARDLGLELWWHPVDARQCLERLADRGSA
jgi:hypothetical protein